MSTSTGNGKQGIPGDSDDTSAKWCSGGGDEWRQENTEDDASVSCGTLFTVIYCAGRFHTPFTALDIRIIPPKDLFREAGENHVGLIVVDTPAIFEESYDVSSWDSSTANLLSGLRGAGLMDEDIVITSETERKFNVSYRYSYC